MLPTNLVLSGWETGNWLGVALSISHQLTLINDLTECPACRLMESGMLLSNPNSCLHWQPKPRVWCPRWEGNTTSAAAPVLCSWQPLDGSFVSVVPTPMNNLQGWREDFVPRTRVCPSVWLSMNYVAINYCLFILYFCTFIKKMLVDLIKGAILEQKITFNAIQW